MFKANFRRRAAGFTLVEIVIAIAAVALLTTLVVVKGNSDDTRTTVLLSKMQEVSSGLLRMKSDFSCFPKNLEGLVTPQGDSDCGTLRTADWKGNYISESTNVNRTDHTIDLATIVPGTELTFEKSVVGTTVRWMLFTKGLPADFAPGIVKSCGSGERARCGFDANRHEAFIVVDEAVANTASAIITTSAAYSGPSGTPGSPATPPLVFSGVVPVTPLGTPAPVAPLIPAVLVAPAPPPGVTPSPAAPAPSVLAAPRAPVSCPGGFTVPFGVACPAPLPAPVVVAPALPGPIAAAPPPGPQCTVGTIVCPRQSIWHFDIPGAKLHLEGVGFYDNATNTFSGLIMCTPVIGHAGFACGTHSINCDSSVSCVANRAAGAIDGWSYNYLVVAQDLPSVSNIEYIADYPYQQSYFDDATNAVKNWGVGASWDTMPPIDIGLDPLIFPPVFFDLASYTSRCDAHPEWCIAP